MMQSFFCEQYGALISKRTCYVRQTLRKRMGSRQGSLDNYCLSGHCDQGAKIRAEYEAEEGKDAPVRSESAPTCRPCRVCGRTKKMAAFSKRAGYPYGRDMICRGCRAEIRKQKQQFREAQIA